MTTKVIRSLAPMRVKLRFSKFEQWESIRHAIDSMGNLGFKFDKMLMKTGDLRGHDILYFKHPKLGTVEVVSNLVHNWDETEREAIDNALAEAIAKAEESFRKLKARDDLSYTQVRERVAVKNPKAGKLAELILIRALKNNGVEIHRDTVSN